MKKILPYAIGAVVVLLFVLLIAQPGKNRHTFDEHITFSKRDKIPYGMNVAYTNLSHIFPGASVIINNKKPGLWDSLSSFSDKQALLIVSPWFMPDEFEIKRLLNFAKAGNDVFISTRALSGTAETYFRCEVMTSDLSLPGYYHPFDDSLEVKLKTPPFEQASSFIYPGFRFDSYFLKYDSSVSYLYGKNSVNLPNFIRFKTGSGNIYLHLAPLAFSNYFLLHKQNMNYYDRILSVIPRDTKKLAWDEYYLHKRFNSSGRNKGNGDYSDGSSNSMLSALMKNRSFRGALWVLIILILLYVFQEMRRKQRLIPVMTKPKNDSLDFVKTIGRLYHEKGDNRDLSLKMTAYFLEHIRNRYKLLTSKLDETFIKSLQMKTGYPETGIRNIVSFIGLMDTSALISDEELAGFHKQLEAFYRNT